jgi:hypothetical protein
MAIVVPLKQKIALAFALFVLPGYAAAEQEVSVHIDPSKIIRQTEDLPHCTIASILNCLQFSSKSFQSVYDRLPGKMDREKLSFVIGKYRSRDSVVKPGHKRLEDQGMYSEDALAFFNELLADYEAPQLNGISASRLSGEISFDFLRRVHKYLAQSLSNEVPVVAGVESYAAHDYKDDVGLKWIGAYSHSILITSVPRTLKSYEKGFTFEFVDSPNGTIEQGYVYSEDIREFQAIRRSGPRYEWVGGSPFLLTVLPSLGLATERQASNARTIMTLSDLIGQFPK